MIAFGCFYTGIFFLFCSFGAGLMRQEIKTEHHILKAAEKQLTLVLGQEEAHREELQSVARLEQQGLSHSQAVQQTHQKYQKNAKWPKIIFDWTYLFNWRYCFIGQWKLFGHW